MWKTILISLLSLLLISCSATVAPNGSSWSDYHAARHNLNVTYTPAAVGQCEELGKVSGEDYSDMGTAKEEAEEATVLLGGNYLLFEDLWYERIPGALFPNMAELYHAEGMAYRCIN